MIDRNLARGLFLAAFALIFGIGALRYNVGTFGHAGAGLFPLMMSCLLLLIAVITIVRSCFMPAERMTFNVKNIGLLLGSLCAFALISKFLDMAAGITAMVFISGFAGMSKYSVVRNIKVAVALILVALAFKNLLGLNLNLF